MKKKKSKQEKYYNSLPIRREENLPRYKELELKSIEKWQNKLRNNQLFDAF